MSLPAARWGALVMAAATVGCPRVRAPQPEPRSPLHGAWRGVLESPGGDLPFGIRIDEDGATGVLVNGTEEARIGPIRVEGERVVLSFPWFDAEIVATLSADGNS